MAIEHYRSIYYRLVALLLPIMAASCEPNSATFRDHQLGTSLENFLKSPEKYEGFTAIARGRLYSSDGTLVIKNFDPSFHPNLSNNEKAEITIFAISQNRSAEPVRLPSACFEESVEVAGTLGKGEEPDDFGFVSIDRIFLLDQQDPLGRGEPCFVGESNWEN